MEVQFFTFEPNAKLRPFISHYWLGLNAAWSDYPILPDGSVDLVINIKGTAQESRLYGTTTHCNIIQIMRGQHYFGIRFKPGQSRYFIGASAKELTDTNEAASDLLNFPLPELHKHLFTGSINHYVDQTIMAYLANIKIGRPRRIDHIIHCIQDDHQAFSLPKLAANLCKSPRQFERIFQETVGISPKQYASIVRFQEASQLLATSLPLVAIAQQVGYTDQSHMTREFKRLSGVTPRRFQRDYVGFVQ